MGLAAGGGLAAVPAPAQFCLSQRLCSLTSSFPVGSGQLVAGENPGKNRRLRSGPLILPQGNSVANDRRPSPVARPNFQGAC